MKIAIAAALFGDARRIGARRPREFARNLARMGHRVEIFTLSEEGLEPEEIPGVTVVELPAVRVSSFGARAVIGVARVVFFGAAAFRALSRAALSRLTHETERVPTARTLIAQCLRQASLSSALFGQIYATYTWWPTARHELQRRSSEDFDVVLSTYGPVASSWIGRFIHQNARGSAWVTDFRDAIVVPAALWPVRSWQQAQQREQIGEATLVSTVSDGLKMDLSRDNKSNSGKKIRVVNNGFVRRKVPAVLPSAGPLRIGYTGTIYPDQLPLLLRLFGVLSEINNMQDNSSIEFHYAGMSNGALMYAAQSAGIKSLIHDHGFIGHEEALALQYSMDLLVVTTWNDAERQGILTGKLLEYLGSNKPILCLVSGNVPSSESAHLIHELGVGFVVEDAMGISDWERLRDFLVSSVQKRTSGELLPYNPASELIDAYEYTRLSTQMEQVLFEAIELEQRNGRDDRS